MNDAIAKALILMVVGMGVVFAFLTLLVVIMNLMAKVLPVENSAGEIFLQLRAQTDRAEFRTAHGAVFSVMSCRGMFGGTFPYGIGPIFPGPFRINCHVELFFPIEFCAGIADGIVPFPCTRFIQSDVGSMSGDFESDYAAADILVVRQSDMFFRGNVAEHGRSVVCSEHSSHRGDQMVVSRSAVDHDRTENVEGGVAADFLFPFHIHFDFIHRDVSRTFHHGLHSGFAAAEHQFSQSIQFR